MATSDYMVISVVKIKDDPGAGPFRTRIARRESLHDAIRLAKTLKNEPLPHWSLSRSVWLYNGCNVGEYK